MDDRKRISYLKRAAKIGMLAVIFFVLLYTVYSVLSFKYGDGIMGIQALYKQDTNSIDVLVLGSSHAFEDVNTGVLYDSYGIAAYVLAGSVQPYWNTYYYLLEALKTQQPKLIILEAYASTIEFEYSDHSRIIKNNLGIKDPITLYQSLQISSPKETFENYLFSYRLWHSRYTELGKSDFRKYYEIPPYQFYKGFGINSATQSFEKPYVDDFTGITALADKTEEYYRKIIELCISKKIPLLITVSPYVLSQRDQEKFNRSAEIAEEYGVEFLNFNSSYYYDLIELDFATDMADAAHLNYIGNVKFTKTLAELLIRRYDLPDRRGDSKYRSWEEHSKDILGRTGNIELQKTTNIQEYFQKLDRENFIIALVFMNNWKNLISDQKELLIKWGIDPEQIQDGSLYLIKNSTLVYQNNNISWSYQEQLFDNSLLVEKSGALNDKVFDISYSILWNGIEKVTTKSGCYLVVYDNYSKALVQICNFYTKENAIIKENR